MQLLNHQKGKQSQLATVRKVVKIKSGHNNQMRINYQTLASIIKIISNLVNLYLTVPNCNSKFRLNIVLSKKGFEMYHLHNT